MNTHTAQPSWCSTHQPSSSLSQVQVFLLNREEVIKCHRTDEREVHVSSRAGGQKKRSDTQVKHRPGTSNSSAHGVILTRSMKEAGTQASSPPPKEKHNPCSLSFSSPNHHRTYCFEGFWPPYQGTWSDQVLHSFLVSGLIRKL